MQFWVVYCDQLRSVDAGSTVLLRFKEMMKKELLFVREGGLWIARRSLHPKSGAIDFHVVGVGQKDRVIDGGKPLAEADRSIPIGDFLTMVREVLINGKRVNCLPTYKLPKAGRAPLNLVSGRVGSGAGKVLGYRLDPDVAAALGIPERTA